MLRVGKGKKSDQKEEPTAKAASGEIAEEEIAEEEQEEPANAFDETVRQIFEVASVCQDMADEMYPVLEGIEEGSALHLAILDAQVKCHVALFNAVINNAGSMVSALQALTTQFGGTLGTSMVEGIISPEGVYTIKPPGSRG